MSPVVFTLPEELADQTAWLEKALVGPDLGRLVAELTALHRPAPGGPTLDELLGKRRDTVPTHGLAGLSRSQVRGLLTRPALLWELQERVLSEGGPYWDRLLTQDAALQDAVKRGRPALEAVLRPKVRPAPDRPGWYFQAALLCLATAAAVLVVVRMGNAPSRPDAPVWGWARAGALPERADRRAYLEALAAEGRQWSDARPEGAVAVAARIGEFRRGCTVLILADHSSLPEPDRKWLKERCRIWAGKLDAALVRLEADGDAVAARSSVDMIADALVEALEARARS